MSIYELFSNRQKRQQTSTPEIYQYDVLPDQFRIQVFHILHSIIGSYRYIGRAEKEPLSNKTWKALFLSFAREKGVFYLEKSALEAFERGQKYLLNENTQDALDFIEYAFHFIDCDFRKNPDFQRLQRINPKVKSPDDAIEELNHRFQEHSIGYYFAHGQLNKQTDQYIHTNVVLPALLLLQEPLFKGAQEEFLKAHQHYLKQNYKEAINEALKAFESTMKIICQAQQWKYDRNAPAKALLTVLFNQGIIPSMLQSQFNHLNGLLESGLPTVRNRTSGHGQGADPVIIPEYIAAYALHTAAANIVFLVHAYKENHASS